MIAIAFSISSEKTPLVKKPEISSSMTWWYCAVYCSFSKIQAAIGRSVRSPELTGESIGEFTKVVLSPPPMPPKARL
jgi:hypothetical protein